MFAADKGVGDGEQGGLLAAVGGELERGETADVNRAAVAEDAVQHLRLSAENAGVLNVDDDGAVGQFFDLFLEEGRGLADDGIDGVDLAVGQGDGVGQRCGAAKHEHESQSECKNLFHR